jgi:hypothetical protein
MEKRIEHEVSPIGSEIVLLGKLKVTRLGWQSTIDLLEIFSTDTGEWRREELPSQYFPRLKCVLDTGDRLYFVGPSDIHVYTIGDVTSLTKIGSNSAAEILKEGTKYLCLSK